MSTERRPRPGGPAEERGGCPWLSLWTVLIPALALKACVMCGCLVLLIRQRCEEHTTLRQTSTEWHCVLETRESKARVWMCCPVGWKPFHTSCYYLSSDTKPWGESQKNCTGMGSHLVVISTEAEQVSDLQNFLLSWVKDVTDRQRKNTVKDFLLNLFKGTITGRQDRSYYIGLSSQKVEGQWHWVDQTPYNQATTFWRPKEPSVRDNETCTVFHMDINQQGNRNWKNNSCAHDFYRICETTRSSL